jgi:hypothetical protein
MLLQGKRQDLQLLQSSYSLRNCRPHSAGQADTAQMVGWVGSLERIATKPCSSAVLTGPPNPGHLAMAAGFATWSSPSLHQSQPGGTEASEPKEGPWANGETPFSAHPHLPV